MTDRPLLPLTRRDVLSSFGVGASAFLIGAPANSADLTRSADIARGTVFEDITGDGVHHSHARGLPGVMVSNGRDVTLSNADGAWMLPVSSGDSLFVIKPAHWTVVRRAGEFAGSYLHQPHGTSPHAGLKSPRVAATGPLPASIDFALRYTPEPSQFDALLVADTQAANLAELSYVRSELLQCIATTSAQFAIHHGDVMGDDLTLLPEHLSITAETGIPWYHCPGNHDMNLDSPTHAHAFDAWKQAMGGTHSAFQFAGATFFLLNNVEYYGHDAKPAKGRSYRGFIGQQQLDFVANVLRQTPSDHLIVVSMHIPLVSFDAPDSVSDTTTDRVALLRLLSGRKHTVSFSGHSHTTEHHYLGATDGFDSRDPHHHHVLTAACGSWWSGPRDARGIPISDSRDGTPKGIHVLSVDGNRYTTRLVTTLSAGSAPLRAMIADVSNQQTSDGLPQHQIVVDVFDGGPRTKVTCHSVELGMFASILERVAIADPHIVESFARHKSLSKPWVTPALSSHIWTMPLPAGIDARALEMTVHVENEFGAAYETRVTLAMPSRHGETLHI